MRFVLLVLAAVVAACSSDREPIGPETREHSQGQQAAVEVEVPLHWHASAGWSVEPGYGFAVRGKASSCGADEPALHPLAIEIGADVAPDGSTIVGGRLAIAPCATNRGPWMPDNYPAFGFMVVDHFGNVVAAGGGAQDQSASVDQYIVPHDIDGYPGGGNVINPIEVNRSKYRYIATFEPEHGQDALDGTRVLGLTALVVPPP